MFDLIASVRATLGEAALDAVIDARYEETRKHYAERIEPEPTLEAKLVALAELRTAEGYMAVIDRHDDAWLFTEHHCPISAAATTCQGFCRNELELFESLLDVPVERVEYLLDGGARCAYRIAVPNPTNPSVAQGGTS